MVGIFVVIQLMSISNVGLECDRKLNNKEFLQTWPVDDEFRSLKGKNDIPKNGGDNFFVDLSRDQQNIFTTISLQSEAMKDKINCAAKYIPTLLKHTLTNATTINIAIQNW